jgi:hypothetical protein
MNYQGFLNNQADLYEFFFLGTKVKTKIPNIVKFQIIEFQINQVLLYLSLDKKPIKTSLICIDLMIRLTPPIIKNSLYPRTLSKVHNLGILCNRKFKFKISS